MDWVPSCLITSTRAPSVTRGMSAHITFRDSSLATQMLLLSA